MFLLIDLSYFAHRARHSVGNLSIEDIPTGILYGFFEQLYTVCSSPRFASNKVMVFADSKHSYRERQFPDYKRKRHENRTEEEWEQIKAMHKQIDILRKEVLPAIGIPVYGQKGLESDDLIAMAASELDKRGKPAAIITSDGDLYQCITNTVLWCDPQRGFIHDPASFLRKKGIRPDQWGMVKAIGGCTTDGVPGVRGVSEQGAIAYLLNKIPHHHKKFVAIQEAFENGEIEKWKKLTVLPHKKTKPVRIRKPRYDPNTFFDFCREYCIRSYLDRNSVKKWNNFFEGKFPGVPRTRRMIDDG